MNLSSVSLVVEGINKTFRQLLAKKRERERAEAMLRAILEADRLGMEREDRLAREIRRAEAAVAQATTQDGKEPKNKDEAPFRALIVPRASKVGFSVNEVEEGEEAVVDDGASDAVNEEQRSWNPER